MIRLKVKEWEKIYCSNTNQKKTGVTMLISDKVDLRPKNITGNKKAATS